MENWILHLIVIVTLIGFGLTNHLSNRTRTQGQEVQSSPGQSRDSTNPVQSNLLTRSRNIGINTIRNQNRINALRRNGLNDVTTRRRLAINRRIAQSRNAITNGQTADRNGVNTATASRRNGALPSRNGINTVTRTRTTQLRNRQAQQRNRINSPAARRRNGINSRRTTSRNRMTIRRGVGGIPNNRLSTQQTRTGNTTNTRQRFSTNRIDTQRNRVRNSLNTAETRPVAQTRQGSRTTSARNRINTQRRTVGRGRFRQLQRINGASSRRLIRNRMNTLRNGSNSQTTRPQLRSRSSAQSVQPRLGMNSRRQSSSVNRRISRIENSINGQQQSTRGDNDEQSQTQTRVSINTQVRRSGGDTEGVRTSQSGPGSNTITARNRNVLSTSQTSNRNRNIGMETGVNEPLNGNGLSRTATNQLQNRQQNTLNANVLPIRNANVPGTTQTRNGDRNVGIETSVNVPVNGNELSGTNRQQNSLNQNLIQGEDLSNRVILTPVRDGAVESLRNILQNRRQNGQRGSPKLLGFLIPRPDGRTQFQMMPDGRRFFSLEGARRTNQESMPFDLDTIVQAARRANLLPTGNITAGIAGGRRQTNPSVVVLRPSAGRRRQNQSGPNTVQRSDIQSSASSSSVDMTSRPGDGNTVQRNTIQNNQLAGNVRSSIADIQNIQLNNQEAVLQQNIGDSLRNNNNNNNNNIMPSEVPMTQQPPAAIPTGDSNISPDLRSQILNSRDLRPELQPGNEGKSVAVAPLNQDVQNVPADPSSITGNLFVPAGNTNQENNAFTKDLLVNSQTVDSSSQMPQPVDLLQSGGPPDIPQIQNIPPKGQNAQSDQISQNSFSDQNLITQAISANKNSFVSNIQDLPTNVKVNNIPGIASTSQPSTPISFQNSIVQQQQPTPQTIRPSPIVIGTANTVPSPMINVPPTNIQNQQPIPIEIVQQTLLDNAKNTGIDQQGQNVVAGTGSNMIQQNQNQFPLRPGIQSNFQNQNSNMLNDQIQNTDANLNQFNADRFGSGSTLETLRRQLLQEIDMSQQQLVADNNQIDQSLTGSLIPQSVISTAQNSQAQSNDLLKGLVEAIGQGSISSNQVTPNTKLGTGISLSKQSSELNNFIDLPMANSPQPSSVSRAPSLGINTATENLTTNSNRVNKDSLFTNQLFGGSASLRNFNLNSTPMVNQLLPNQPTQIAGTGIQNAFKDVFASKRAVPTLAAEPLMPSSKTNVDLKVSLPIAPATSPNINNLSTMQKQQISTNVKTKENASFILNTVTGEKNIPQTETLNALTLLKSQLNTAVNTTVKVPPNGPQPLIPEKPLSKTLDSLPTLPMEPLSPVNPNVGTIQSNFIPLAANPKQEQHQKINGKKEPKSTAAMNVTSIIDVPVPFDSVKQCVKEGPANRWTPEAHYLTTANVGECSCFCVAGNLATGKTSKPSTTMPPVVPTTKASVTTPVVVSTTLPPIVPTTNAAPVTTTLSPSPVPTTVSPLTETTVPVVTSPEITVELTKALTSTLITKDMSQVSPTDAGVSAIGSSDATIASMSRIALKTLISDILKEFFAKQQVVPIIDNQQPTQKTIDTEVMAGTMAQAVIEAQALQNKAAKNNQAMTPNKPIDQGQNDKRFPFNPMLSRQEPAPPMDILLQSMSPTGPFKNTVFDSGVGQLASIQRDPINDQLSVNKNQPSFSENQFSFDTNRFSLTQDTNPLTQAIFSASDFHTNQNRQDLFSSGQMLSNNIQQNPLTNPFLGNSQNLQGNSQMISQPILTDQNLSPEFQNFDPLTQGNSFRSNNVENSLKVNPLIPNLISNENSLRNSNNNGMSNKPAEPMQNLLPFDITFPDQGSLSLPQEQSLTVDTNTNFVGESLNPVGFDTMKAGIDSTNTQVKTNSKINNVQLSNSLSSKSDIVPVVSENNITGINSSLILEENIFRAMSDPIVASSIMQKKQADAINTTLREKVINPEINPGVASVINPERQIASGIAMSSVGNTIHGGVTSLDTPINRHGIQNDILFGITSTTPGNELNGRTIAHVTPGNNLVNQSIVNTTQTAKGNTFNSTISNAVTYSVETKTVNVSQSAETLQHSQNITSSRVNLSNAMTNSGTFPNARAPVQTLFNPFAENKDLLSQNIPRETLLGINIQTSKKNGNPNLLMDSMSDVRSPRENALSANTELKLREQWPIPADVNTKQNAIVERFPGSMEQIPSLTNRNDMTPILDSVAPNFSFTRRPSASGNTLFNTANTINNKITGTNNFGRLADINQLMFEEGRFQNSLDQSIHPTVPDILQRSTSNKITRSNRLGNTDFGNPLTRNEAPTMTMNDFFRTEPGFPNLSNLRPPPMPINKSPPGQNILTQGNNVFGTNPNNKEINLLTTVTDKKVNQSSWHNLDRNVNLSISITGQPDITQGSNSQQTEVATQPSDMKTNNTKETNLYVTQANILFTTASPLQTTTSTMLDTTGATSPVTSLNSASMQSTTTQTPTIVTNLFQPRKIDVVNEIRTNFDILPPRNDAGGIKIPMPPPPPPIFQEVTANSVPKDDNLANMAPSLSGLIPVV